MTLARASSDTSGAAVRRVQELAVELGRVPTAAEVRRALGLMGLAADDALQEVHAASHTASARTSTPTAVPATPGVAPSADAASQAPTGITVAQSTHPAPRPAPEDAWWGGILDLGQSEPSPDRQPRDLVREVVDDLAKDWDRAGRRLGEEEVARLMEKRRLGPGARSAVLEHLLERGMVPTMKDTELPSVTLDASPSEASSDHVKVYLSAVGHRRLLTADEEVQLGRLVRRGQEAEEALAETSPLRTPQERRQLENEIDRGREARARFIEANLRLVVSLAYKRLTGAEGVELLDLIQFGNLGLIRAVEKFDPELGYKFSTYATWWIRQSMDRGVADSGRLVRLPVHVVEKLTKVRSTTRHLQRAGHVVTAGAVAALTGLDRADVEYLWSIDRPVVRLDAPVGPDSDATLADVLGIGHMGPGPEELVCRTEALELIPRMVGAICADNRSASVVTLRFGINTDEPMTLEEIGKVFGVTRERIRQLEIKALERLRAALSPRMLRDLLEAIS